MIQQMVPYIKIKYIITLLKVRPKDITTVEQVILHIHITMHIRQSTLTYARIWKAIGVINHCFTRKVIYFTRKVKCFTRKANCFTRKANPFTHKT